MAILAKPTVLPLWATDGGATRVDPSMQEATGWTFQQAPPFDWMNWLQGYTGDWLAWLDNRFVDGGAGDFQIRPTDMGTDVRYNLDGDRMDVVRGLTAPTQSVLIQIRGSAITGHYGKDDIKLQSEAPGIRFRDTEVSSCNFRLGMQSDQLVISVDTDDDDVTDGSSGHYDDTPDAFVFDANGDLTVKGDIRGESLASVKHVSSGIAPATVVIHNDTSFLISSTSTIDENVYSAQIDVPNVKVNDTILVLWSIQQGIESGLNVIGDVFLRVATPSADQVLLAGGVVGGGDKYMVEGRIGVAANIKRHISVVRGAGIASAGNHAFFPWFASETVSIWVGYEHKGNGDTNITQMTGIFTVIVQPAP